MHTPTDAMALSQTMAQLPKGDLAQLGAQLAVRGQQQEAEIVGFGNWCTKNLPKVVTKGAQVAISTAAGAGAGVSTALQSRTAGLVVNAVAGALGGAAALTSDNPEVQASGMAVLQGIAAYNAGAEMHDITQRWAADRDATKAAEPAT